MGSILDDIRYSDIYYLTLLFKFSPVAGFRKVPNWRGSIDLDNEQILNKTVLTSRRLVVHREHTGSAPVKLVTAFDATN